MPDNGFESFHSEFYRTHFPSPTRNADYPEEVVCKSFGFRLHKDIYYEHLVEMNQEQFMARVSRKRTKKRLRDNVRNRTGIFRFGSKDTKTETTAPRQPVGIPASGDLLENLRPADRARLIWTQRYAPCVRRSRLLCQRSLVRTRPQVTLRAAMGRTRAIGHTSQDSKPESPRHFPLPRIFFALLAFAHRAFAAFVASVFLSSGLSAAMRFLPPSPPAALPPFLPISRMTSEIRFFRITLSYEEVPNNGQSAPLTPEQQFERPLCH
jgi:hypothetical protein